MIFVFIFYCILYQKNDLFTITEYTKKGFLKNITRKIGIYIISKSNKA